MGLPCPHDTDPADFYLSYLSDPVALWQSELQRRSTSDVTYIPLHTPPLNTEEMQLYFRASMHRGQWAILLPNEMVRRFVVHAVLACDVSLGVPQVPQSVIPPAPTPLPVLSRYPSQRSMSGTVQESDSDSMTMRGRLESYDSQRTHDDDTAVFPEGLHTSSDQESKQPSLPRLRAPNSNSLKQQLEDDDTYVHVMDTACVKGKSVRVELHSKVERKMYQDDYMHSFTGQLKVRPRVNTVALAQAVDSLCASLTFCGTRCA